MAISTVACEEIFDESSHPSIDEIRDYAVKIGIDPDSEPQFISIAEEGLMRALPPGWKPCLDEKSKSYYYFNKVTGATQWEHPLDDVYRGIVMRKRTESQSLTAPVGGGGTGGGPSAGGGGTNDDNTYTRDDLPSYEEGPPLSIGGGSGSDKVIDGAEPMYTPGIGVDIIMGGKYLEPLNGGKKKLVERLSRIEFDGKNREAMFKKQLSDDNLLSARKIDLNLTPTNNSLKTSNAKLTDTVPKKEFKLSGEGFMFLKSNTKIQKASDDSTTYTVKDDNTAFERNISEEANSDIDEVPRIETFDDLSDNIRDKDFLLKGILRDSSFGDITKAADEDDKKNVRFKIEDDETNEENEKPAIKERYKPRFSFFQNKSASMDSSTKPLDRDLKLIKPYPKDFLKVKRSVGDEEDISVEISDSEDESAVKSATGEKKTTDWNVLEGKNRINNRKSTSVNYEEDLLLEEMDKFDNRKTDIVIELRERMEKEIEEIKQNLWLDKNEEINNFKEQLDESHNQERNRVMEEECLRQKEELVKEIDRLKAELADERESALETQRNTFAAQISEYEKKIQNDYEAFEKELKSSFEARKEELRKEYEMKRENFETEMGWELEKHKDELIVSHKAILDQMKQNHQALMDEIKRDYKSEEKIVRREHENQLNELRKKVSAANINANVQQHEDGVNANKTDNSLTDRTPHTGDSGDLRQYEKLRCEKRLLEDKYRCLKEKYLRLKTDVKLSIEKRNRKRELSLNTTTTTTTGSETEKSNSINKKRSPQRSSSHHHYHHHNQSKGGPNTEKPPLATKPASLAPPTPPPRRHPKQQVQQSALSGDGDKSARMKITTLTSFDSEDGISDAPCEHDEKYESGNYKEVRYLATHDSSMDEDDLNNEHRYRSRTSSTRKKPVIRPRTSSGSGSKSTITQHANSNNNINGADAMTSTHLIVPSLRRRSPAMSSSAGKGQNTSGRSCSPVENLRRQLQKLEDLEDQFPPTPQVSDAYHLRYPFSDGQTHEGSSELEFFRHRIHLERDSIKRAKENLRTQRCLFQQRQNDLKLKHGSMARHTYQQLCQEEKELTDMEVSLHRTRSLLGEKVIRLRHLEQSLHRASTSRNSGGTPGTVHGDGMSNAIHIRGGDGAVNLDQAKEDATATLSDMSSASSGISSSDFATAAAERALEAGNHAVGSRAQQVFLKGEHLQESSEIIQSLENLNWEIREIWEVLGQQQQQHVGNVASVMPIPLVYSDLGWPVLTSLGQTTNAPMGAVTTATPTMAALTDRLQNYHQQITLTNPSNALVTPKPPSGNTAATALIEQRARSLRNWLARQNSSGAGGTGILPPTSAQPSNSTNVDYVQQNASSANKNSAPIGASTVLLTGVGEHVISMTASDAATTDMTPSVCTGSGVTH